MKEGERGGKSEEAEGGVWKEKGEEMVMEIGKLGKEGKKVGRSRGREMKTPDHSFEVFVLL